MARCPLTLSPDLRPSPPPALSHSHLSPPSPGNVRPTAPTLARRGPTEGVGQALKTNLPCGKVRCCSEGEGLWARRGPSASIRPLLPWPRPSPSSLSLLPGGPKCPPQSTPCPPLPQGSLTRRESQPHCGIPTPGALRAPPQPSRAETSDGDRL